MSRTPPPPGPPESHRPQTPQTPVIELEDLEVRLGGRLVLKGISGALSGRAVGLLGPNGAGKTTLLNTLLGFHRPAAGTARVFGRDVRTQIGDIRAATGYMPESDAFVAGMSGVRFVTLMAELAGLPPAAALERAHEALFYVGLGEARYRKLGSYSTGMKQLVKLAQAIVHGPRLLLLDEPTDGLDPPARERMLRLIRDIRASGEASVIVSSHLLHDVERCCDEVLVLKDGEVALCSDLAAERRAERRLFELDLYAADGAGAAFIEAVCGLGCECAPAAGRNGGDPRLKVVLPAGVSVVDLYRLAAERGVEIRRLAPRESSLEDLFLEAMGIVGSPRTGGSS